MVLVAFVLTILFDLGQDSTPTQIQARSFISFSVKSGAPLILTLNFTFLMTITVTMATNRFTLYDIVSRDSTVGIATGYGLDD
jgi:hypothetical protein